MKIAIIGATGRMGISLIKAITQDKDVSLHAVIVESNSGLVGSNVGSYLGLGNQLDLCFSSDLAAGIKDCDVVIDFTNPIATMQNLDVCRNAQVAMVIGTTGLNSEQKALLSRAAQDIPIVYAANFSVGINLLLKIIADIAPILANDFDIEVIEAHHRHKVDAPSGTALKIGEVLADSLNHNLSDCAVYERYGQIGARQKGSIGFSTIRGGDIVGDHTVLFAGMGERLELTHKASSRDTFAHGVIRAAKWLIDKKPSLYDMQDVLN